MASVQALINNANGGRQGNANYYYYALANQQYTASTTACQAPIGSASNPTVTLPAASCNFHDIISGSIIVPTSNSGNSGIGFSAVQGFDVATGLGSVDIANVAHNWSSVTFRSTTTTLSLTPLNAMHGAGQTALIQVTSNTGTPTGDVALIATANVGTGTPQVFRLTGGSVNGAVNSLPGGTYTVYAHYAGDGTYAPSDSAPVTVNIAKEDSVMSFASYRITSAGSLTGTSAFTYGAANSEIYLDVEMASQSGDTSNGTPSGKVTFAVSKNGSPTPSLTTSLDTYGTTYFISGPPIAAFYLLPNYSILGAGSYSVTATYAGDASFNGTSKTIAFTVAKQTASTSFTTSTAEIPSGGPAVFNLVVTTTASYIPATGTVTFTDNTTNTVLGTASVVNGRGTLTTLAITAAGAHSITGTFSGDGNYNPVTSNAITVTVGGTVTTTTTLALNSNTTVGASVPVTITISPAPTVTTPVSLYDGGVFLGSANVSTSGSVNLSVSTFTGGTHNLSAIYAGNSTQKTSTGTLSAVILARPTTINIGGTETAAYGDTVLINGIISRSGITATTAPAIPLTGVVNFYEGSASGALLGSATPVFGPGGYGYYIAPFSTSTLSIGSHSIVAAYQGDGNYGASVSGALPVTINKLKQTITFTGLPANATYGSAGPYTLNASSTSGLPITYTVTGPATISGNTLTITGAGTVTVTASQAGNDTYSAATPVSQTIVVAKANQTITFTGLPANATYGSAGPYTLNGSSNSGLPVTYTVTGPATISGNTLTITGAGTVTVTASQAGNANYNAATPVSQTIVVSKANQTITFTGLPPNATYGSAGPYTLNGSSSSGLAVTYTVTGPGTISGNMLTITGPGTVTVTASQPGNANYNAATPVSQTIVVSKTPQTITFNGLPSSATYGSAGPYTLNGTASSGLPVTYTVSGPGTVSGNTLTITSPGTVTVTASQSGNANYAAATPVSQTIVVNSTPAGGSVSLMASSSIVRNSNGSYTVTVHVTNNSSATATNVVLTGVAIGSAAGTPTPQSLGNLAPGASANAIVTVPASAGASGSAAVEKITGTYTGGSFGGSYRVTLP